MVQNDWNHQARTQYINMIKFCVYHFWPVGCSVCSTDLPDVGSLGAGSAKGLWATCAQTTKAGRWPVIPSRVWVKYTGVAEPFPCQRVVFSISFHIQCLFAKKFLCFEHPAKIHVQNVALGLFNMTSDAGCWYQSPWDGFEFASALDHFGGCVPSEGVQMFPCVPWWKCYRNLCPSIRQDFRDQIQQQEEAEIHANVCWSALFCRKLMEIL